MARATTTADPGLVRTLLDWLGPPPEGGIKPQDHQGGEARMLDTLAPVFGDRPADLAEENVQARLRGLVIMALSNKFGWLVLTTGNKSELSVGYATLYGDMAGGFAVIKDVFKGWVYRLVRWRNEEAGRELVPASVLERPPSAELRSDQRDQRRQPRLRHRLLLPHRLPRSQYALRWRLARIGRVMAHRHGDGACLHRL
jgi:hypothetical protein